MKLGEVLVHIADTFTTTSPIFIEFKWKTKKFLLITHLAVQGR